MKRTRRQTIRRGNITGKQRRRLARLARRIDARGVAFCYGRERHGADVRDARRLHEAGHAVAVASKATLYGRWPREIALYKTMAAAVLRYPRWCVMRSRR